MWSDRYLARVKSALYIIICNSGRPLSTFLLLTRQQQSPKKPGDIFVVFEQAIEIYICFNYLSSVGEAN